MNRCPSDGLTPLRGTGDQYLFVREAKISPNRERVFVIWALERILQLRLRSYGRANSNSETRKIES